MENMLKITLEMNGRAVEHKFVISPDYLKYITDCVYTFVESLEDKNLISLEDVQ